jgi:outer membrane immunogenic protein
MKASLLANLALVAFGLVTPASAADLAPRYKPVATPMAQPGWTGFYLGADIGGKWGNADWAATSLRDPPGIPPKVGVVLPIDASSPTSYRPSSVRAGLYAGYYLQLTSQWVGGIEADVAWANASSSFAGFPGCALGACTFPNSGVNAPVDSTSVRMRWDASLRARLGYLVTPDLLAYGTGGVAWQNIETSGTCGALIASDYCNGVGAISPNAISHATTLTGWTLGAGLEWRFAGSWLVRGEYRYSDFGSTNDVFGFGFSPIAGDNTYRYRVAVQTHMATLGLAYKFNWVGGAR